MDLTEAEDIKKRWQEYFMVANNKKKKKKKPGIYIFLCIHGTTNFF